MSQGTPAVADRGCWAATTDCMSTFGNSVSGFCGQVSQTLGNFWSTTLQPCLSAIATKVYDFFKMIKEYADKHPDNVAFAAVGFVAGAITTLFISWCCCSTRNAAPVPLAEEEAGDTAGVVAGDAAAGAADADNSVPASTTVSGGAAAPYRTRQN